MEEQRQLIRDVVAGRSGAAHRFVELWQPSIEMWIASATSPSNVEDYSQEVWIHLADNGWRNLLRCEGLYDDHAWHEHSLRAFLKQVTIRKTIDLYRAEMRQPPLAMDAADIIDACRAPCDDPALEAEGARLMAAYEHCSGHFKDRDHRLLDLWWEGFRDREIAGRLRMLSNNVCQRRHYLFRLLRDCLVEKLPEYFDHD